MIVDQIKKLVLPGTVIPKPEAKGDFVVRDWRIHRGEMALTYLIPNHRDPRKPYKKGVTESEFEKAYQEIQCTGSLTRTWFDENLPACAKEGGCNFTTIGGVFQLLGIAVYLKRGEYRLVS